MDHYGDRGLGALVYPFLEGRDVAGLAAALGKHFSNTMLLQFLAHPGPSTVKIAVTCLGLTGQTSEYAPLTRVLPHADPFTVRLIEHALSSISFRQGTPDQNLMLRRAVRLIGEDHPCQAMLLLNRILVENPDFAEAYCQRALLGYLEGAYPASIEDGHRAIELNPHHYAAHAQLGHAYAQVDGYAAALECYYAALRIHPRMEGLHQAVRCLRTLLTTRGSTRLPA